MSLSCIDYIVMENYRYYKNVKTIACILHVSTYLTHIAKKQLLTQKNIFEVNF